MTVYMLVFACCLAAAGPAEAPEPPEGMVYVPAGPFIMGSNRGDADEMPRHTANTGAFFIDKYEVSNAEFRKYEPGFSYPAGKDNHAAKVTWEQAAAYAAHAGKRLPTEKEWEKAAWGTDGRTYPWGESYDAGYIAWDENDARAGSEAVPESPYGCVDIAGNAWEWTADWYRPYPGNLTPCDAYGEKYKVMRGGASFNGRAQVRCAHRYYLPPDATGGYYVGFRCVRDVGEISAPEAGSNALAK
jgi:formylglycine-generating enzyme required for sulfatase activity